MGNHYFVPCLILVKQAQDVVENYRNDSVEHQALLAGIGVTAAKIQLIEDLAEDLEAEFDGYVWKSLIWE